MDVWTIWRFANVGVALAALALHVVGFHCNPGPSLTSILGRIANMAWCAGYSLACAVATILPGPGGSPGPWTGIMTVPAALSLATGVVMYREARCV